MNFTETTVRPTAAIGGFIANAASAAAHVRGLGLRVDPADFGGEDVPAGTVVGIETRGNLEYAVPFQTGVTTEAVLTLNDVLLSVWTGSTDTVSVITGGQIYANRLPAGTPTAEQKTALGQGFSFIRANF